MSDLEENDSDYDSMFGDDLDSDSGAAGISGNPNEGDAGTDNANATRNTNGNHALPVPVPVPVPVHVNAIGGEDADGYDSMFEDDGSDNVEQGETPNGASTCTSTRTSNDANDLIDNHQNHADPSNSHTRTSILGETADPTAPPSDNEDFDEMFGDESSEEEVEVVSVDIHKTIIPRRKRKFGQDAASSQKSNRPPSKPRSPSSATRTNLSSSARIRNHPLVRRRPDQYKQFDMDDFWRALRSWDFATELNQSMKRGGQTKQDEDAGDETAPISISDPNSQPLPDAFHCPEEYIARWAPLQIKETKAQILSDMSSNRTMSYQKITMPIQATPKKGGRDGSYSECLELKITSRSVGHSGTGNGNGTASFSNAASSSAPSASRANARRSGDSGHTEFMQNDLVLITCDSSIVEQAYKGILRPPDKSSYSMSSLLSLNSPFVDGRLAIMGTVTQRCKSLDALVVQVSRRLWKPTSMGASDLFLLRLGSNITAIREFRALCGMKDMPLSKCILSAKHEAQGTEVATILNATNPLSQFGGSNALGIGFRIFVKSKFNTSQQAAISAAAREYGDGGFTLVKGPPGTGKTTTLVALLNALHLRQYQKYYTNIERITLAAKASSQTETLALIAAAAEVKPRILVCAPSNAAVDNVILKIVEDRFLDGNGSKYSPSIIRIGSGQSAAVASVALDEKVNKIIAQGTNLSQLEIIIRDTRKELKRLQNEIRNLQLRVRLIANATTDYSLSRDWEVRIDEPNFETNQRVMYVNHTTKKVQLTCPPRPNDGEELYPTDQMPHYRGCMSSLVKYIERHNDLHSKLLQLIQVQNVSAEIAGSKRSLLTAELHQNLETSVLDSTHIVMTTLGSSGSRTLEGVNQFSVIVVDEAAQSCEPSMLPALQLGSNHCVLVGDPQQLPATIFSMSGRSTKYDRSLFQRLEEAGHHVYMLNTQYRMHPMISSFPRRIFYDGSLVDGPNVTKPDYGSDLKMAIRAHFRHFQPLTVLDIDSTEERDGTSLCNKTEARLALHLFTTLRESAQIKARVAIITPYQQQVALLRRIFQENFGLSYSKFVDISTIDSFQGKESPIVILSCVRASPEGGGIGFLSDVQRMNVALTRAKHFLFVIARCESIVVNPYWRDFVGNAREQGAILKVTPRINNGLGRGPTGTNASRGRGSRGARGGRGNNRGKGPVGRMDIDMFPDLRNLLPAPTSRRQQHF